MRFGPAGSGAKNGTQSAGVRQYGTLSDMEKFNRVDWAKLNPRRQAMIERFNREIKV
jgi:hypothetical protein